MDSQAMKHFRKDDWKAHLLAAVIIGVPLGLLGFAWHWYQSSVQAEVYRRQGVEMSTWEVMLGTKPIERTINIK